MAFASIEFIAILASHNGSFTALLVKGDAFRPEEVEKLGEWTERTPDIFLAAAERLGVAAARSLVVEDAPNGVQAAKAAGARCLGLTTSFAGEVLSGAGADWLAPDLSNVPAQVLA